jgi:Bacteriophage T4-like portal protein (Gp20)
MDQKNLTIWQRLSQELGPNSLLGQDMPTYKFDKKELLRTQDKAEYEKQKLQAQQTFYIASQWAKIENNLYSQAVYYEPTRLASYYDYESMEYTPEISAALDTYAEESTTVDEDGYMLQIYCDSPRIKAVLGDLFNNALDINTNLPMWTRNTAKYGDNFVFLKLDPEKGVVGCLQLPNIEVERIEVGMKGRATSGYGGPTASNAGVKSLTFTWKNKQLEFNSWEIAHFRLLGDDRKLPYGTSMLEKARRTWKQLVLAEDAMLVYRTSRAPERRVFKVFVGNMDDADIQPYVQRFAQQFKKDQVVDPQSGNVDMRFNQMAVDQDFFIPVRDPGAPNPIETLPGAQNLSEIADIEYIQKKLLTALRIPKAFLGFEEVVGDGRNLSLQDIRFARTINRIQKSMVAELNKIAIIHLFLLGFEDELGSFQLSLTNPSKQADLLTIDVWKEKMLLYKDAVAPIEGIAPTSQSWAKKHILGFSDEEIKLDLQQQRLEKAVSLEIQNTGNVITKTGIFDNLDRLYGNGQSASGTTAPPAEGGGDMMADLGGAPPAESAPPAGGETAVTPESIKKDMNIILERDNIYGVDDIDLEKGSRSLGVIEESLRKLID